MAPFPRTTLPAHLNPEKTGEKAKTGRPSEYRPEFCQMVIEAMSNGDSLTGFAGSILVDKSSVYAWIKQYPEFSRAVGRAQAARVLWWERKLQRSRKGAETTAAIFALRNAAPDEWRDQKYTQHQHVLDASRLTDAQLHAIAAGAAPSEVGVIDGECERVGER